MIYLSDLSKCPPVSALADHPQITEYFFRHADLTGKDHIIGQQIKGQPKKAYVAYVKLIPRNSRNTDKGN